MNFQFFPGPRCNVPENVKIMNETGATSVLRTARPPEKGISDRTLIRHVQSSHKISPSTIQRPHRPTFIGHHRNDTNSHRGVSTVDLCLANDELLHLDATCNVADISLGSDHLPLIASVRQSQRVELRKRRLSQTDWFAFHEEVMDQLGQNFPPPMLNNDDIDDAVVSLLNALDVATKLHVPMKPIKPRRPPCWINELRQL